MGVGGLGGPDRVGLIHLEEVVPGKWSNNHRSTEARGGKKLGEFEQQQKGCENEVGREWRGRERREGEGRGGKRKGEEGKGGKGKEEGRGGENLQRMFSGSSAPICVMHTCNPGT